MWILFYLALLVVFSFGLVKSTHMIVSSIRSLVVATGVNEFGLASFVLAFSTSLPELSVALTGAIHGQTNLVLGNVLGSNIANISLILGLAAVVAGSLKAYDSFLTREVFYAFIAGSMPLLLLLDGSMGRREGALLILVYVIYNFTVLANNRHDLVEHEVHEMPLHRRLWMKLVDRDIQHTIGYLVLGIGGLLLSADLMVQAAIEMAVYINLPILFVGLIVVAVGTSLPELVFELVSIREGDAQMGFGNILGSIVTNSSLIMGIAALIRPVELNGDTTFFWYAMFGFVVLFSLFWYFVWTKKALERWEGIVLVLLYMVFVGVQLL